MKVYENPDILVVPFKSRDVMVDSTYIPETKLTDDTKSIPQGSDFSSIGSELTDGK